MLVRMDKKRSEASLYILNNVYDFYLDVRDFINKIIIHH